MSLQGRCGVFVFSIEHIIKFLNNDSATVGDHLINLAKGQNVDGEYTIVL